jgi:cathepsin B
MKLAICVLLLIAAINARHPVNQEIVDEIKQSTNLWWPAEPKDNHFQYHSEEQIVGLMGTKIDHDRDVEQATEMGITNFNEDFNGEVPVEFNSTAEWTECPFDIRDQGQCGSCWAFGAVESLEDRLCIKSGGNFTADLSEQNVIGCDYVGFGCQGGWPLSAFAYLSILGTVTEECFPYTAGQTGSASGCTFKCKDKTVSNKRYRCQYPWINFTNSGIKNEIAQRGPVETGFTVYEDFMNYQGGIYDHITGKALGGHAVKITGWGVENGTQYWIAANSWSTSWGEDGFFKIKEGSSGFGSSGYSCVPYSP